MTSHLFGHSDRRCKQCLKGPDQANVAYFSKLHQKLSISGQWAMANACC